MRGGCPRPRGPKAELRNSRASAQDDGHDLHANRPTHARCSTAGSPSSGRRSSPRCRRWPLQTGSINLGQGFPDTDGPEEIREAAVRALRDGRGNQYPPGPGVPELRTAIADHQRRRYGLSFDPDTEVLVTAGATEAIAAALLALLEPGDEVVALEPYYDSYAACIAMAGGTRVPVTLRARASGRASASTSTSCGTPSPTGPGCS